MKLPFSASIYEHAAYIIGKTPWEVSRNAQLMYEAHREAYKLYRHCPIIVGIDIYNLEAEAYGCKVVQPKGNGIPAIVRGIFSSLEEAQKVEPFNPQEDGRILMIIEAGQKLAKEFPDTEVWIPVSGPFSIARSLRGGNNFLYDVADSPEKVSIFLQKLIEGQVRFGKAIKEAGLKVDLFESAAAPPLLSPQQFRNIELPALKELINRLEKEIEQTIPCIIGGNTIPILKEILTTGTNYVICPAETDRKAFMEKLGDRSDITVRINLDSWVVSNGPKEKIIEEVDKIIALAKEKDNIVLGTGAVLYETDPENILFIKHYLTEDHA